MKILFFDTHGFERKIFDEINQEFGYQIDYLDVHLTEATASLAKGYECICAFVNDRLDEACLQVLKYSGVKLIALRSSGFNNVDLLAASKLELPILRVPEYSPHSVAEHAVAMMLTLNRKLYRSYNRVRELNFSLDGLLGFDMRGKTVGIIGTGKIGSVVARILHGFGCKILAHDLQEDARLVEDFQVRYTSIEDLCRSSDIITLHVPLNAQTKYLIDKETIRVMRPGVMIINTSRGGLINTHDLITYLKNGHIGYAGLDVYEEEADVFFQDHSQDLLKDDVLARLLTFPNVFITSHQGFLTREALTAIAEDTLRNIHRYESKLP